MIYSIELVSKVNMGLQLLEAFNTLSNWYIFWYHLRPWTLVRSLDRPDVQLSKAQTQPFESDGGKYFVSKIQIMANVNSLQCFQCQETRFLAAFRHWLFRENFLFTTHKETAYRVAQDVNDVWEVY